MFYTILLSLTEYYISLNSQVCLAVIYFSSISSCDDFYNTVSDLADLLAEYMFMIKHPLYEDIFIA